MSYDANQRDAYRVQCVRCRQWWNMTRWISFVCLVCRMERARQRCQP